MKSWLKRVLRAFVGPEPLREPVRSAAEPQKRGATKGVGTNAVARLKSRSADDSAGSLAEDSVFCFPKPVPGVIPRDLEEAEKKERLAYDSMINDVYSFALAGSVYSEGLQFMGYPYLSELTQRPEYRRPAEILAKEMTRKWMKIQATGDGEQHAKDDKIKIIEEELKRLEVQKRFREAAEQDGFFGRSQIFIDMGDDRNNRDLMRAPLLESSRTIGKRKRIERLVIVEPTWTYPNFYNSYDPLDKTFFKPQTWYVMGTEIHASRFLTFVSRKVPDILKPAYAFGGLSLSQIMKPYVDNWLRTRQSVSDLLHSFSIFGLKTNLGSVLNGGGADELINRAMVFNLTRDNNGLQVLDKDTEDFFNVSAPLGGLDHLQAQSQEHQSAASGIPLVKLLGITPSGLNASSDGEMRAFYDWIEAQQEATLTPELRRVINIIQLYKFGEIDPEITFKWEPLWSQDEGEQATTRKTEADTDAVLIDKGIIDPLEARTRLATQKDSAYSSLDLDKVIEAPGGESDEPQLDEFGNPIPPDDSDLGAGLGLPPPGSGEPPKPVATAPVVTAKTATAKGGAVPGAHAATAPAHAQDEFLEEEHPRDKGKFTSGAGGSSSTSTFTEAQETEAVDDWIEGLGLHNEGALESYLEKAKPEPEDRTVYRAEFGKKMRDIAAKKVGDSVDLNLKSTSNSMDALREGVIEPNGDDYHLIQIRLPKGGQYGRDVMHSDPSNPENIQDEYLLGKGIQFKVVEQNEGLTILQAESGMRKLAQDDFQESEHPRDHGKFAKSAGASGSATSGKGSAREHHKETEVVNGERRAKGGKPLPEHISKLRIPPAWTEVTYSPDKKAALLATGKDAKGRRQWVYSDEHNMKAAAAKFSRIQELNKKFDAVLKQNETAQKSTNTATREHGDVLRLIMMTGIRPGSDVDTKAEKKAYGATTLEGKHVVVRGDKVELRFVGKKGVDLTIPVTDPSTARMLKQRKAAAGNSGKLFPNTTRQSLSDHTHSLDGGGFKTKDFRTLLGTRTAMAEVAKIAAAPKTMKEYKKAVKDVATVVAAQLGNTPTIALQSYINPVVFSKWSSAHANT